MKDASLRSYRNRNWYVFCREDSFGCAVVFKHIFVCSTLSNSYRRMRNPHLFNLYDCQATVSVLALNRITEAEVLFSQMKIAEPKAEGEDEDEVCFFCL